MSQRTEPPSDPGVRRRACTNCTVGKAKCTPFSPDECERCHRLGKECHYASLATRRRNPQSNSRLQVLERQVRELAARQRYSPRQPPNVMSIGLYNSDSSSFATSNTLQWPTSTGTPSSAELVVSQSSRVSPTRASNSRRHTADIIDRGVVTKEMAQTLLDRFRDNATEQFPFVVIPAGASLDSVRQESPFLFLVVVATMLFDDPSLQHQLGEDVREQALHRILLGAEKSLDLLQGLLVYTTWYCHFYQADKHQELLMSQLCVTLAHDLGISKNKRQPSDNRPQCKPIAEIDLSLSLANAQMRAYLGTYCVSCLVASILRNRTALPYTKYVSHCCQSLAGVKEYATDELIPHLVRSQRLSRLIADTFSFDDLSNGDMRGEFILTLTSDAFLRDVDALRLEVPPHFQKNTLLDLEFHFLRMMINEIALHAEFWTSANGSEHQARPDSSGLLLTRSKMLWSSLNSCKEFIHTFLALRNEHLFYLTAFVYPRLYSVFITLARLVFAEFGSTGTSSTDQSEDIRDFQSSSWSTLSVAKEADFLHLAKEVLEKFTAVAKDYVGADGKPDAMSNFASAMRILISGYEQQMNDKQRASKRSETVHPADGRAQEPAGTAVDLSAYSPGQGIGNGSGGSGIFDMPAFAWDSPTRMAWDDMLETFTMGPFS